MILLEQEISEITEVPISDLKGQRSLVKFTIMKGMSWRRGA